MFAAGDLVVYGGEGVCRVESIGPSGLAYDGGDKVYYHLSPLYRGGTVMTPVDTAVLMRPIISRDCALKLIAALPVLPEQKPCATVRRSARWMSAISSGLRTSSTASWPRHWICPGIR